MSRFIDITGKKYNKLTVLSFYDIKDNKSRWLCQCDCGNKTIVKGTQLKNGKTKSCGCLLHQKKYDKETEKKIKRLQHIYSQMKQRCYKIDNHIYKYYGGKGITICDEWLNNSNNFYKWALENGYDNNLTIERINVNGNYEPSNCKWITKTQQGYNKTNSKLYTIENETKCLSEWCKIYNIDYFLVRGRLKFGWNIKEALTKPIKEKYRNKLYKERNDKCDSIIYK